jgi:hypothetical protein
MTLSPYPISTTEEREQQMNAVLIKAQRAMLDAKVSDDDETYTMTKEQFNCFVSLVHFMETY